MIPAVVAAGGISGVITVALCCWNEEDRVTNGEKADKEPGDGAGQPEHVGDEAPQPVPVVDVSEPDELGEDDQKAQKLMFTPSEEPDEVDEGAALRMTQGPRAYDQLDVEPPITQSMFQGKTPLYAP